MTHTINRIILGTVEEGFKIRYEVDGENVFEFGDASWKRIHKWLAVRLADKEFKLFCAHTGIEVHQSDNPKSACILTGRAGRTI